MKHLVLIALALAPALVFGQSATEVPDPQLLCAPFARHAASLLEFVEAAEANGDIAAPQATAMRRVATSTIDCAASETRFRSRAEADSRLALIEGEFRDGAATALDVSAARVAVEKAGYCAAAFSYLTASAELYEKKRNAGRARPGDVVPILAEVELMAPVCGRSENEGHRGASTSMAGPSKWRRPKG